MKKISKQGRDEVKVGVETLNEEIARLQAANAKLYKEKVEAEAKAESKVARKDLKELTDIDDIDADEQQRIISLIERANQVKKLLGSERDKKTGKPVKGDPNYGLLAEMVDLKADLQIAQIENNLPGLRQGRVGAVTNWMDGRFYLSDKKLLDAGVTADQIAQGYEQGEGFYQTTVFELNLKDRG